MFKRVERKRKRREEEEELGLDEDTKETLGLNNTDSDESDSDSEHNSGPQFDSNSDADIGNDRGQEADATPEDEIPDEESPISVSEVLKDPIYLISLDPTIYGCVVCKGKLIKNAGMATAHKNATAHRRHFQHFKLLSADANLRSNAWELVRAIRSTSDHREEYQELSKRTLKRQVKQAAVCEKRKFHKQLRAKAIAKKAIKKLSIAKDNPTVPSQNSQTSLAPQNQPGDARKKQKLTRQTYTATIMETESRDTQAKPSSHTKATIKKVALDKKLKSKRKPHKPHE